jgi:hypothetical protein
VQETDPDKRSAILSSVTDEMSQALRGQWDRQQAEIDRAEGRDTQTEKPSDRERAFHIAEFFKKRGLRLPDVQSEVLSDDIDYEDIKAKIVQWEGLDMHDFNIYDDRAAQLWRKPYLDGAVRELTSGDDRTVDEMAAELERAISMSKSKDRKSKVRLNRQAARADTNNQTITIDVQPDEELRREVRRNAEDYR